MNHNNPSVSVVIRVKNEESFIGHAIQSCIDHLNFPKSLSSIIIQPTKVLILLGFFRRIKSWLLVLIALLTYQS